MTVTKLTYFNFLNSIHSFKVAAAAAKSLQSCPTLCDPMDCSPPGSSIHVAAAKSRQSCPTLCDPIDSSPPASLSLGFSRQEHWSVLPFPSPMHGSEK